MSVTVTLHVFSGVPDPAWELSDAQAAELAARINRLDRTTMLKPPGIFGGLGYRGFSIQSVRERSLPPQIYAHQGIVDLERFDVNLSADDAGLEAWLLETAGSLLAPDVKAYVQGELSRISVATPAPLVVPPYDPGKWNNDPNIRQRNNCYNYANDKITNTFAQPGRGSGLIYTALECGNVGAASQRDGQVPSGPPTSTPAQGHYIALVVQPGHDFHWYRLDSNARWSHKPGSTPARNTDNSGRPITDPRTCDRGPYTAFCGFYLCVPANTRIN